MGLDEDLNLWTKDDYGPMALQSSWALFGVTAGKKNLDRERYQEPALLEPPSKG